MLISCAALSRLVTFDLIRFVLEFLNFMNLFPALANPNSMIFVLLLTKKDHTHLDHTELVKSLLLYKNVQFKFVNLETLTQNTPAEKFYKSNHLAASIHLVEHTADFLRMLLLWKFGGTYLDHDVIVRKPITITNFACFQQPGVIVNGILNCDKQHGHDTAEKFLEYELIDLFSNFV